MIAGIWQFTAQRNVRRTVSPFLKKQLDLCFLATETASRLASETDPVEWEKARVTFWRLYWGQLSIVENRKRLRAQWSNLDTLFLPERGDQSSCQ